MAGGTEIFKLLGSIFIDNTEANRSIKKTGEEAENTGSTFSRIGDAAKKAGTVIGGAMTAVAGAAVAAGAALWKIVNEVADVGDNVDKTSQKLGLSREGFQEWGYILKQNGADINSFSTGMKTLQTAMVDAADGSDTAISKFEAVGLTLQDLKNKSPEQSMELVIQKLQQMPEGAEKTAAALDLFGKKGMDLMPMLNQTAEGTEELRKRAHDLGIVMGDDLVDASVAFGDAQDDFKLAIQGAKNEIVGNFLPGLADVTFAFSNLISGQKGAAEELSAGIQKLAGGLKEAVPGLIGTVGDIAKAVAGAAPDIIESLAGGILDALPDLAKSAVSIVTTLLSGIGDSLPKLVPAITKVVTTIVQTLADGLPDMLDAGLNLLLGLADGIIKSIPVIIEALPDIIFSIVDYILGAGPQLMNAGIKLIGSLFDNMPSILGAISTAVGKLIGNMFSIFTSSENKDKMSSTGESYGQSIIDGILDMINPVKVIGRLIESGKNIAKGLIDGIKSGLGGVSDAGEKAAGEFEKGVKKGAEGVTEGKGVGGEFAKNIKEGFTEELSDLPDEVSESLDEVNKRIEEYSSTLRDMFKKINNDMVSSPEEMIATLRNNTSVAMQFADDLAKLAARGMNEGYLEELKAKGVEMAGVVKSWTEATNYQIKQFNKSWEDAGRVSGESVVKGLSSGVAGDSVNNISGIMRSVAQQTKSAAMNSVTSSDFWYVGTQMINGIIAGVNERGSALNTAIVNVAKNAFASLKQELGIRSPSRKFKEGIALPIMQGWAGGISENARDVINAVSDTAKKLPGAAEVKLSSRLSASLSSIPQASIAQQQGYTSTVTGGPTIINNHFHGITIAAETVESFNKVVTVFSELKGTALAMEGV